MRWQLLILMLMFTCPVVAAAQDVRIDRCLVSLIVDRQIAAQEAGLLVSLQVREGVAVAEGAVLGHVNDSQAQLSRKSAVAQQAIAEERANEDVEIRYAQAAASVAEYEYKVNREANDRVPGARSVTELQRLLLQHRRAMLEIEASQHRQKVARLEGEAKAVEVEAADDAILRRQVIAPLAGEVVEVYRHVGEWVQAGDAVVRLVQLDRLRIEGFVNAAQYSPDEIQNRPVSVTAQLARGRVEQFTGQIVHVHPQVNASGEYRVWAEVVNRRSGDAWLLLPGMYAEMSIQAPPLAGQPSQVR